MSKYVELRQQVGNPGNEHIKVEAYSTESACVSFLITALEKLCPGKTNQSVGNYIYDLSPEVNGTSG